MADLEDVTLDGRPLQSLRVADLKAALEERGLSKSGQKNTLIKRLKGALMLENLQRTSTAHIGLQPNSQIGEEMSQNSFIKQYLAKQQELLRQRLEREAREAYETNDQDDHAEVNNSTSCPPPAQDVTPALAEQHKPPGPSGGDGLFGAVNEGQGNRNQEADMSNPPPSGSVAMRVPGVEHRPERRSASSEVAGDSDDDDSEDGDEDGDDDDWDNNARRRNLREPARMPTARERSGASCQPQQQHIPSLLSPQLRQPTPPPSPPPELSFPLPDTPKQSPPSPDVAPARGSPSTSSSGSSSSDSRSSSPEPQRSGHAERKPGPLTLLARKMESEGAFSGASWHGADGEGDRQDNSSPSAAAFPGRGPPEGLVSAITHTAKTAGHVPFPMIPGTNQGVAGAHMAHIQAPVSVLKATAAEERDRDRERELEIEREKALELERQEKLRKLEQERAMEEERQRALALEREREERERALERERFERQQALEREEREKALQRERELALERERQEREQALAKEREEREQALARERALELERQRELERQKVLEQERLQREKEEREKREREERERAKALEREREERERALEQERMERERALEAERKERERIEREKALEQERLEKERLEREKALEQERIEREKALERERIERERALEQERIERERIEREKALERERIEREKALEQERLEREKALEKERLEKERKEKERLEQERREKERLEQERKEKERLEKERLEQERKEKERLEQERKEKERLEQERREKERLEQERREKERLEQERREKERIERERALEQERIEKEKALEREREEKEKAEREAALERERNEKEKAEKERKERLEREKALEQEKLERARALEKERKEKERALEQEKAMALERERLEKEKAMQKEREEQERALEQEKERARMAEKDRESHLPPTKRGREVGLTPLPTPPPLSTGPATKSSTEAGEQEDAPVSRSEAQAAESGAPMSPTPLSPHSSFKKFRFFRDSPLQPQSSSTSMVIKRPRTFSDSPQPRVSPVSSPTSVGERPLQEHRRSTEQEDQQIHTNQEVAAGPPGSARTPSEKQTAVSTALGQSPKKEGATRLVLGEKEQAASAKTEQAAKDSIKKAKEVDEIKSSSSSVDAKERRGRGAEKEEKRTRQRSSSNDSSSSESDSGSSSSRSSSSSTSSQEKTRSSSRGRREGKPERDSPVKAQAQGLKETPKASPCKRETSTEKNNTAADSRSKKLFTEAPTTGETHRKRKDSEEEEEKDKQRQVKETAMADPEKLPETSEETPKAFSARKISLSSSKSSPGTGSAEGDQESAAVAGRKRRWGSSTAVTAKKPSISITTDSLKSLIPDIKPCLGQEAVVDLHPEEAVLSGAEDEDRERSDQDLQIRRTVTQVVPSENQENGQKEAKRSRHEELEEEDLRGDRERTKVLEEPMDSSISGAVETQSPTHISHDVEINTVTPSDTLIRRSISQQKTGVSITIDDPVRTARQPSPPRGKVSAIVHVCNLVRPFTLGQLKELLSRTGTLVDEGFWIDKIKSHCYVTYSSIEEAVATRAALHGVKWPQSNPKVLSVDFCQQDELDFHKGLGAADRSGAEDQGPGAGRGRTLGLPSLLPERDQWAEREREMERRERARAEREWDRDKVREFGKPGEEKEGGPRRSRSRERRRKERGKSKEKKTEKKEKAAEDPPAKLLDDLFRKTKAAPCIYWLPLTEEQFLQREAARAERMKEREKRRKEQEEEEERKERMKAAGGTTGDRSEGEKDKDRDRERDRDRGRDRHRDRERERERERDNDKRRDGYRRPGGSGAGGGGRRSRSRSEPRERRR